MPHKRILVISDLHSGHRAGLTPPQWWGSLTYDKWARLRSHLWRKFAEKIQSIQPIDVCFVNGDCIDGRGERSGSTELITSDRHEQCKIATGAIKHIGADKYVMTRGTPYHSGDKEQFEDLIAKEIGAVDISYQSWPVVNGVTFDLKHHVGGTSIPHGKGTSISKEHLWNLIHNDFADSQPRADITIRSHVHFYHHIEDVNWHGFVTPSLQGLGTKFGAGICSGIVFFGFIWFDIEDKDLWMESPKYGRWVLQGGPQRKEALIL